jgi:hypothetical protein
MTSIAPLRGLKAEKVTQNTLAEMAKVTQHFRPCPAIVSLRNILVLLLLLHSIPVPCRAGILNSNIEQGARDVGASRTPQESDFLDYFARIDTDPIEQILTEYRSTGPAGYCSSLVLARILKVKERICSDRELCEKLAKNPVYRVAVGMTSGALPAHNTFTTLRRRLGPEGFARIHTELIMKAHAHGLLIPPLKNLPQMVKKKIILIADSTFLIAVASTKGEKNEHGVWCFSDPSIAFGRPHHKHKYPVGHRAHTVMSVSGIPIASLLAPANESDSDHIMPLLHTALDRFPTLPFGCVILDSGYDSEELHRAIYNDLHLLPVIVRKPGMKYPPGFSTTGTPLCPFGFPTRRKGIEYNHRRTKFACYRVCEKHPQQLLFECPHKDSASPFGWMTRTRFKDGYRRHGPAAPGSRTYTRLKPLRTGIERYYGLAKENRYKMEVTNTYTGHDNVLIHVIEHDIVLTLDILFQHSRIGKWSDVIDV